MKVILIGLVLVVIGFALGFESGTNWAKMPKKEPIPEWYKEYILSHVPPDSMSKADCPSVPKRVYVKEAHEKLQPKLYKLKKGYKNE